MKDLSDTYNSREVFYWRVNRREPMENLQIIKFGQRYTKKEYSKKSGIAFCMERYPVIK